MPSDLIRLLTLHDENTRIVLLGTGLLGMSAGLIGALAVLRRRALLGDALAHAAYPGICLAFLVVQAKNFAALMVGAALTGALGILTVAALRRQTRIKEDAAIGIVLSVFFGLGAVLARRIQSSPGGNKSGIDQFLFGKANAMVWQDVRWIAVASLVVLVGVLLLYKEFRLLCFDREFAAADGWPVTTLDLALMGLLVVCTVMGLPAVGVVLMAALLIIPAAAARFWTERLSVMLVLSALLGGLAGATGSAASALSDRMATGPVIVLAAAAMFGFSVLFAPRRGVLADALRRMRMRSRIAEQHLLRAAYEVRESRQSGDGPVGLEELLRCRSWRRAEVERLLHRAAARGHAVRDGHGWRFTPAGRDEAARVVRAHRIWELYLVEAAAIAPDHVDRDADDLEHYLPADLLGRLEQRLRETGRLPAAARVPTSPHALAGGAA